MVADVQEVVCSGDDSPPHKCIRTFLESTVHPARSRLNNLLPCACVGDGRSGILPGRLNNRSGFLSSRLNRNTALCYTVAETYAASPRRSLRLAVRPGSESDQPWPRLNEKDNDSSLGAAVEVLLIGSRTSVRGFRDTKSVLPAQHSGNYGFLFLLHFMSLYSFIAGARLNALLLLWGVSFVFGFCLVSFRVLSLSRFLSRNRT